MANPEIHYRLEFHDSMLAGTVEIGKQIILLLRAYIHQYEDGIAKSCWIQAVVLTFSEAVIEGGIADLPADIWHSELV